MAELKDSTAASDERCTIAIFVIYQQKQKKNPKSGWVDDGLNERNKKSVKP
jgi:hypothetical protein